MISWKAPSTLRVEIASLTRAALHAALGADEGSSGEIASISRADRLRIAICVAPFSGDPTLEQELGVLLDEIEGAGSYEMTADKSTWDEHFDQGQISLFKHSVEIALAPKSTGGEEVISLQNAGISDKVIVAASQVTAFMAYFGRLRKAGQLLSALNEKNYPSILVPYTGNKDQKFEHPRKEYPLMDWRGFVIGVPPTAAGRGRDDSKGASDYYSVLQHEPGFLEVRTELYDTIMTGEGELEREEREFIALATSLETGCEFCATVHGRRHFFLSKDTVSTPRLKHLGVAGLEGARQRALAGFASAMATAPSQVESGHLEALKDQNLNDKQIMDAAAVSAMFSWANRLMLTLGEGTPQP